MTFLYPLGLLGLIGIPIIIIIYIIKNKHTEQTITTTHIWLVAERLMKKRRPISRIYGLISLLIQLIAVTAISLAISQPRFTIKQGANQYMFILDGSCSMNVESNGVSRFDRAKQYISNVIYESGNGSFYTLVYASDSNRVVYEDIRDKDKAIDSLYKLDCGQVNKNILETISFCQEKFSHNSDLQAYLITDKEYDVQNVKLVNLAVDYHNVAITDLRVESKIIDPEEKTEGLEICVDVLSYVNDCNVKVKLYCDNVYLDTLSCDVKALTETSLTPYKLNSKNFALIKAELVDGDGLALDNSRSIYNTDEQEDNKVLLVSDTPHILKSILKSLGGKTVDTMSVSDYIENETNHAELITNYKLYIFDSVSPNVLPNAAVMFFNCYDLPKETNVTTKERPKLESAISLELSKTNTSLYKELTQNVIETGDKIAVTQYIKYSQQAKFTNIYEYRGYPMIFAGATEAGQREVVFSFNVSDSDLSRRSEFIALMNNLVNYCLPVVVNKASYTCGDKMLINVVSGCDSIMATSPSGQRHYLPINSTIVELDLVESGVYTIEVGFEGRNQTTKINIFSMVDTDELLNTNVDAFYLSGNQTNGTVDGIYDSLTYLFVILTILFVLDWMVYCYEQYQLR